MYKGIVFGELTEKNRESVVNVYIKEPMRAIALPVVAKKIPVSQLELVTKKIHFFIIIL